MKNKNLFLVALAIFSMTVISFGTYALWDLGEGLFTTENTITSGQVIMSFSEKNEITLNDALPMSDTDGKRLDEYFDFSVSTYIKTNVNDSTSRMSYYNVFLEKLSPTSGTTTLNDSEIKVYLTEVASNGSETQILAPTTIDKLGEYLLTSGNEEFKNNKTRVEKNFRLRAWINIDVNASKFDGTTAYSYNFRLNVNNDKLLPNLDTSNANKPALLANMIPVYYDATCNNNEGCWEKADGTNKNEIYKWYNYDEKMWANAVTVESTNRSTYMNASEGTEIPIDEINAMWVWIPRYTYTYFNDGTNTSKEIQMQFEQGTESNGTIVCTDNVSGRGETSQTCTDTKTNSLVVGQSTYTHPAFTFGDKELTGFWMGKFENSATEIPTETSTAEHEIIIKPNQTSLRYKAVSYQFRDARQMEKANNIYGFEQSSSTTFNLDGTLTGDTNKLDIHMLKNIEWGAVAYLSHSKYGINKEVAINSYGHYMTGCGPRFQGSTTNSTTCNAYNTTLGRLASTTGNIYGVYDMSGGSYEYVMGNMVNELNEFYSSQAEQWSATTKPLPKYYDSYTYYSNVGSIIYTRGRLGDATIEMAPTGNTGNWYSDYAGFVFMTASWFHRGGYLGGGDYAGVFNFASTYGAGAAGNGFRSALCSLVD